MRNHSTQFLKDLERSGSLQRILLPALLHQRHKLMHQLRRQILAHRHRTRRRPLPAHHGHPDRRRVRPKRLEGRAPRQQLVERDPQRVNVHCERGWLVLVQLGGEPAVRAGGGGDQREGGARRAKVGDLRLVIAALDEHVEALDVAVDQLALRVEVEEPRGDVSRHAEPREPGELRIGVLEQVEERSVHELHDDERWGEAVVVGEAEAEERHDVGVPKTAPFDELPVSARIVGEELLDGHRHAQVVSPVHGPVAACGERFGLDDEVIHGDEQARHEVGCGGGGEWIVAEKKMIGQDGDLGEDLEGRWG